MNCIGDWVITQKSYTVDFLSKKVKKNDGEVPQYYVESDHPAIIAPEVFDMVQSEMASRLRSKGRYSGVDKLSAKIKCGQCGGSYGPKVWHSTDKYRRVVYQCNHKSQNGCTTPHLEERQIEQLFISAVNELITEKDETIANLELVRAALCDTSELENTVQRLHEELSILAVAVESCVSENTRIAQDQSEYQRRYESLVTRYESVKLQLDTAQQDIANRKTRNEVLGQFTETLREQPLITEFDERLWGSLLDCVIVYSKKDIRFVFKDGTTK